MHIVISKTTGTLVISHILSSACLVSTIYCQTSLDVKLIYFASKHAIWIWLLFVNQGDAGQSQCAPGTRRAWLLSHNNSAFVLCSCRGCHEVLPCATGTLIIIPEVYEHVQRWKENAQAHDIHCSSLPLCHSSLCSFQHTCRDEGREEAFKVCNQSLQLILDGLEKFLWHVICEAVNSDSEVIR